MILNNENLIIQVGDIKQNEIYVKNIFNTLLKKINLYKTINLVLIVSLFIEMLAFIIIICLIIILYKIKKNKPEDINNELISKIKS